MGVYRTGYGDPAGWCLKLYPRSGLGCKKHTRLANCVGIIDSDYRGEIMAKLITDPGGEGVCLKPGMAVMQGIFERVEQVSLVEVEESTKRNVVLVALVAHRKATLKLSVHRFSTKSYKQRKDYE
ncbi:deoxyuridine 5'-triphosphate nucleotidohydrolase [Escherichia coli]|uniref:Deoxyuridine 5'-triphosphate nucleotidohydrolase n=1 Tax=Escherichia coli TaxID=562 RepID=A0A2X1NEL3_ECOLX|nr:deoxyuridine 5'-triphosphate nucleotidohydrolase [Escherichia coli]